MRVFITGIGMVTPLGIGVEHNWQRMLNGETNIQPIPEHWHEYADFNSKYYCPLPEISFLNYGFTRRELLQKDPVSLLTMLTTDAALEDAGISKKLVDKKLNQYSLVGIDQYSASIVAGVGQGGATSLTSNHSFHILNRIREILMRSTSFDSSELHDMIRIPRRFNPFVVSMMICNSISSNSGFRYSIKGPVETVVQACSSGTTAIGNGFRRIKHGEADFVICSGSELMHDESGAGFFSFDAAQTLVQDSGRPKNHINRPFDCERTGFLFSEGGAASLILESEQHLDNRNGVPIAEILGYAETFDAYSLMAPEPGGVEIERMIKNAVAAAELNMSEVSYVNSHGTGTVANDNVESRVIERILGGNVPVNSTKSIIGHTIGASGAIEAAVSVLSIRDQELHPSLNIDNPIADLDFVTERRKHKVDHVLTHSFAFGGHNSGLVISRVE